MPYEPNYFGVKMGEAIAGGAEHIASGLERKYELQRKEQERQRLLSEQQNIQQGQTLLGHGFENTPEGLQAYIDQNKKTRGLDEQKTQAEINALSRGKSSTIPPGYRMVGNNMESIPGGPAYQKEELLKMKGVEEKQKKMDSQNGFIENIDNALMAITKAKKNVGLLSTGVIGGKLIGITPSAGNLKSDIETINSFIGLGKLMDMKNASKNGASGFGTLSDKELALLTSSIRSLDQKLVDPPTMRENLDTIADMIRRWKERTAEKIGKDIMPTASGELIKFDSNKIAEMEAAIARGE